MGKSSRKVPIKAQCKAGFFLFAKTDILTELGES